MLTLELAGVSVRFTVAADGDVVWVGAEGSAWAVREAAPESARASGAAGSHGPVRSPMPGTVQAVHVAPGDTVVAGQPVVTVEAMKMEYSVAAAVAGVVATVRVRPGQAVALEEVLAEVHEADPATGDRR
ncbi:hypothetical protein GHK86_07965 [Acidimicrobiaceae bacterium USS-CC1]|uniref:Lipoyl-binding domain-containing protein n=1 Tax=Acidiferrimicrobium australe TaxID=2664430 RepID=A0ABW9QS45_9ACTN|nr:hypothetical protein [Acidiferrimicrobium australe]